MIELHSTFWDLAYVNMWINTVINEWMNDSAKSKKKIAWLHPINIRAFDSSVTHTIHQIIGFYTFSHHNIPKDHQFRSYFSCWMDNLVDLCKFGCIDWGWGYGLITALEYQHFVFSPRFQFSLNSFIIFVLNPSSPTGIQGHIMNNN
jgi:hypothetical protein